MPLQKLQFRPGVNREGTTLSNEGGWFDCDKIRFRSGYPEKIGGWTAIAKTTFLGVCRSLWNWVTLSSYNLLGVGTNLKFYVYNGGTYNDITPIRLTTTNTTSFTFTVPVSGTTTTVTVTDTTATGLQQNDFVTFSGVTNPLGGLNLNGEFQITNVLSNIQYEIVVNALATSPITGGGGGAVTSAYQLNTGSDIYTVGTGWGTPPWGGFIAGTQSNFLNGGINNSVTTIVVNSTTGFSTAGALLIGSEYITYTGKTSTDFTGCVRGANGTTAASHLTGAVVAQATTFPGWGVGYTTGVPLQLRLWSQANFGEDLLFNPRGGAIYLYQPGAGAPDYNRGLQLGGASLPGASVPTFVNSIMVSDATRITIAFGCNDIGLTAINPMLIRWSAQENYLDWYPSALNQAGGYQLSHGSTIVSALQTRQEILVWTDACVYSMQYLGPPSIYGFNILADNISIASPNTVATASGVTYWMGVDKFYVYSGRVETLPCAVRTYIYNDINLSQSFQFFASTNEGFSEIWWFYCSANSTVVDRYVIFNYLDRVWYYGSMGRTAWIDSPISISPIAATYSHVLVNHEVGVNDATDPELPQAIPCYVQSSDFDIGDGHNYGFVWQIIPDITFDGSLGVERPQATFTVRPRRNPGSNYDTSDTPTVRSAGDNNYLTQNNYNVQQFTQTLNARLRGRQMAFRVSSDSLGTQWQLGTPRLNVRPDGRK